MNKTFITVAINGSRVSKEMNPSVPVTIDEIVSDIVACFHAGASIAHVHTRHPLTHQQQIDKAAFLQIKEKVSKQCNILLNFSTSGEFNDIEGLSVIGSFDGNQQKRVSVLDTKPNIATVDLGTINFGDKIFLNPTSFHRKLIGSMLEHNVKPELEIFNVGDIELAKQLIQEHHLQSPQLFQFALGVTGGTPATVEDLVYLKSKLPDNAVWSAFGIGKNHLKILYTTIALGGNVRVGLEDNIYYKRGELTTNVDLVKRAARIIREFNNEVATPSDVKAQLGI